MKKTWHDQYLDWQKRDLKNKHYVYLWADGVYMQARQEEEKNCMLVVVGADEHGQKEIVAINDGFRESKESWRDLLLDLKERGLEIAPSLATGDGALGFWGALTEVYPQTKHQRCWVHKTMNVLNKLPKSSQSKAKIMLHDIYMAETKEDAEKAWKKFLNTYGTKYPKVEECLSKDKSAMLEFYNFPAEHWKHLRSTNPIESTFATVKHRTKKSKNCFSRTTLIAATFKLMIEAQKRWKKLSGSKRIAQVINMEKFINGVHENEVIEQQNEEQINAA